MTCQGLTRRARRGAVLVYTMVAMVAFVGLCSLAVDYGRAQMVKTELQSAADAAARAGAGKLSAGPVEALLRAQWVASQNSVNGEPLKLDLGQDFELGLWDKKD